jgi:AcrR family transcriptional regulator
MNRKERKDSVKRKIVDTLFTLYADKTFYKMTSDEISKRAQVSKRTLYKYFSSKEDMYLEIVKVCFIKLNGVMRDAVEKTSDKSAKDTILAMGKAYLNFCLTRPEMSLVINEFNQNKYEDAHPERVAEIDSIANEFDLAGYVEKHFKEKEPINDIGPESFSIFLWAQIQGLSGLLSLKRSWIEQHYKVDGKEIIKDSLKVIDGLLEGNNYVIDD